LNRQKSKYKLHRTEKEKKIWESLYLLEVLFVKKDCGKVDREKGD
jgi:hypothetical protein